MATVGTLAHMLVHEIRNRTTAIGEFLEVAMARLGPFNDDALSIEHSDAVESVAALERLAETFLPLASRNFRRRNRDSVAEERISICLTLHQNEISQKGVVVTAPSTTTRVAVDPAELDSVLLNLISNSLYWLNQTSKQDRKLHFKISPLANTSRVRLWVHDSGPGVSEDDLEDIFRPGVTRKPGGIGMGLTVASEIVSDYGGKMSVKAPGTHGGASFAFDLPLKV